MSEETVDYVIIGAGSAGCVLADRLSADGKDSVLVLEYGGEIDCRHVSANADSVDGHRRRGRKNHEAQRQ